MPVQRKCEACRISDNACDLQRPTCSRCTANSIACVYADTAIDFVFVDQNDVAAISSRRAAYRRSRAINRRTTVALDTSLLAINRNAATRHGQLTELATPILYNLDDRVVQRFLSRWAMGRTLLGCLDSMPRILEVSGRDSAMQSAILATAYADLAVMERHGDRGTKAHQAYLRTLQRLQGELSSPNFMANDDLLAAILAIDAFELLYMGRIEPLGIHTQAILRLLELRKNSITRSDQSFSLWLSAYQRIHARQLFWEVPSFASHVVRSLIIGDDTRPEARTIKFVGDACDIMSQLKNEQDVPAEHTNREEIIRLCAVLRTLMQEAHEWSEYSNTVPRPRRIRFNVQPDSELKRVFPQSTIIAYDSLKLARDRLLFNICGIKILDKLIELRTELFSSRHSGDNNVDRTREFLLAAQPDLADIQAKCRFALDVVPLLIGVVDSNGATGVDPWNLNDTGVLTVKSPLKTIGRINYVSSDIKAEANAVLNFLDAHKHVIQSS